MSRIFNFSAGPATLPLSVLEQVREELLDWGGSGMSVMEMSHRGKHFISIAAEAEADLRDLLNVPPSYKVLFMQGGAYAQFAYVPMNLLRGKSSADYIVTGSWSLKAVKEALKYASANIVVRPSSFTRIPEPASWRPDPKAAYRYYVPNETIEGVEFDFTPDFGDVPLVADFSSSFLSQPIDINAHGLIYAGAQKNAGPAGLTIVIVREDLIGQALPFTPAIADYKAVSDAESMLNTPPCFSWYVSGLVFKWLKAQGGLTAMGELNARKAAMLYEYIDSEPFYSNPIDPPVRSRMNVVFRLGDSSLDAEFVRNAEQAGLSGLKGHRSVGGMRASLYNALPEIGVAALIEYMREFVRRRG